MYGSISSTAEWGLKRGCAVALTDAGKGPGLYDPTDDTVMKIDGTRAARSAAGALSFFAATITDAARAAYNDHRGRPVPLHGGALGLLWRHWLARRLVAIYLGDRTYERLIHDGIANDRRQRHRRRALRRCSRSGGRRASRPVRNCALKI